jgi:GxxExxY protein
MNGRSGRAPWAIRPWRTRPTHDLMVMIALPQPDWRRPMDAVDAELDDLAHHVVDAAFHVHSALGPGLLEGVYETCLAYELDKRGVRYVRQLEVPVVYDGKHLGTGFRIDLLVGNRLIVELKAVESVAKVHKAQLLTYMKLMNQRLGLLINFNVPLIRQGITRMIL